MHDPQKQQELEQHEVLEVLRFLKRYGKLIGAGVLAAAIAMIASMVWSHHQAARLVKAGEMLRDARTPQQLEEVVKKYGSTQIAPAALLDLAKSTFNDGNYTQARTDYQQFLKKYGKSELRPVAELGLAYCTEADGNFGDAVEQFKAFAATHEKSYLQPAAVLSIARCLQQAARTNEARIVLEDFLAEHGDSSWAALAEGSLKQMDQ